MLRNLLIAITKAFKWFVGWPRPVLVPKFKTGCFLGGSCLEKIYPRPDL